MSGPGAWRLTLATLPVAALVAADTGQSHSKVVARFCGVLPKMTLTSRGTQGRTKGSPLSPTLPQPCP